MSEVISVIIPVYNVELYLDDCVNSVINQSYSNLEVILVDDCSPDRSGEMCDEWAEKESRIKVIHKKKNEGLGYARNSGLEVATGDYILFLDSDDFFDLKLCEKALNRLKEENADICVFGHKKYYNGIAKSHRSFDGINDNYEGKDIINEFLAKTIGQDADEAGMPKIGMSAWRVLYKASVILENNIRFCSERDYLNEDLFFRIDVCKSISKVAILKEDLYFYRYNDDSLTTRYRKDRFDATLRFYNKLCLCTEDIGSDDINERCIRAFTNNLIVCIKQEEVFSKHRFFDAIRHIRGYCRNDVVQELLGTYPIDRMPFKARLLFLSILHKHPFMVFALTRMKRLLG